MLYMCIYIIDNYRKPLQLLTLSHLVPGLPPHHAAVAARGAIAARHAAVAAAGDVAVHDQ